MVDHDAAALAIIKYHVTPPPVRCVDDNHAQTLDIINYFFVSFILPECVCVFIIVIIIIFYYFLVSP